MTIIKDLKNLRDKVENIVKQDKIAIVCWHLLMTTQPIKALVFKRIKIDDKDSGKTYCCEVCAMEYEEMCKKGNSTGYSAIVERKFAKNISDIKII